MKNIFKLFSFLVMSLMVCSCIEEDGAGVPMLKQMHVENAGGEVVVALDQPDGLTLRWIDVTNATYAVELSNPENDVVMGLENEQKAGPRNTISMNITVAQLTSYLEAAGFDATVENTITASVTGYPVKGAATALDPDGSTLSVTVKVVPTTPSEEDPEGEE